MSERTPLIMTIATALWLLAIGLGLLLLLEYSYAPGDTGAAPQRWPSGTKLRFVDRTSNLIMFVHPKCPCSRASMREFEEIVARCQDLMHGQIVFVQPPSVSDDWVKSDLWNAASAIPGVAVSTDVAGRTARRFGARTSGHTLLFAADKQLVFSGGITSSRGHEGDNLGRGSVIAFLTTGKGDWNAPKPFPVFGCPLLESQDESS